MTTDAPPQRAIRWPLGLLTLFALVIITYWPLLSRQTEFLWDDDMYVTQNPLLKKIGGLSKIWFSTESPSQYFPLTYTSFWIEYRLWGLHPRGFQIVNVTLHALNALLIWMLLHRMKIPGAWLAAAIFAVHPVNVESVAWITERKNVLSGALFWASLLAWHAFIRRDDADARRWRIYAFAFGLFVLALFAKTTACVLPAALVLTLWIERRPLTARRWLQIAPFVAWGLAMGLLTLWWEHVHQRTGDDLLNYPWTIRPLVAGRALWFYIAKLLWPHDLSFSYPAWNVNATQAMQYLPIAGCVMLGIALWFLRARRRIVAAIVFFIAALSPTIGLIPLYTFIYTYVADHYQYLACVGIMALVAGLLIQWGELSPAARWTSSLTAALVLAALTLAARRHVTVYQNPGTLWSNVLKTNPDSWMAYSNLGLWKEDKGDFVGARRAYEASLAIRADNAKAYLNLAILARNQGEPEEAVRRFREGLAVAPGNVSLHLELANHYASVGQVDEAIAYYRKTVALHPSHVLARINLAALVARTGGVDEAESIYLQLLEENPELVAVHDNLANLYARTGRHALAIRHYERSLELHPDRPMVWNSLGASLAMERRTDLAEHAWRESTRLDPNYADAYANWGLALLQRGRRGEAKQKLETALSLNADIPVAKAALDQLKSASATAPSAR